MPSDTQSGIEKWFAARGFKINPLTKICHSSEALLAFHREIESQRGTLDYGGREIQAAEGLQALSLPDPMSRRTQGCSGARDNGHRRVGCDLALRHRGLVERLTGQGARIRCSAQPSAAPSPARRSSSPAHWKG